MRTLPLDGLLTSLGRNFNHRIESARLFESALTYMGDVQKDNKLPEEIPFLTFVAFDTAGMDFFDIKGDVEQVLLSLGIDGFKFSACGDLGFLHPGRSAQVYINDRPAGWLGELHPNVRENYEIGVRAYAAAININVIHEQASLYRPQFISLPKFPSVQRDLAFKVKVEISAAQIEAAVTEVGGPLLREIKLFDVYQGPQIEENYKSMAYSLRFRADNRTLTDEDVLEPIRAILDNLQSKCGAELRDK
jgi:phenylalanyl-tRNA synthetase beta chain